MSGGGDAQIVPQDAHAIVVQLGQAGVFLPRDLRKAESVSGPRSFGARVDFPAGTGSILKRASFPPQGLAQCSVLLDEPRGEKEAGAPGHAAVSG